MKRWLFNLAALLSLSLFLLSAYLWTWMLTRPQWMPISPDSFALRTTSVHIFSIRYGLRMNMIDVSSPPKPSKSVMLHLAGFWIQSFATAGGHMSVLVLPSWFLLMLFAALPGIWSYRRLFGPIDHGPGFCTQCGYDLRASPEKCPECGTIPKPQAALPSSLRRKN